MSKSEFWKEMDDVRAAMLGIGSARHVPMAPYPNDKEGVIWFITAKGTDLVKAIEAGETESSLIVTGNGEMHARVEGRSEVVQDREKLEELWNPIASSWFDGIDDPDIRLIRFTPDFAEVWATKGAIGFAIQIAKAKVTDEEPDMGDHFEVRF
ncbi:pyridoxamine 5'-phosphate oxidase family protein (plasmid) [Martelella lutilitoris]|uniref:Pyridoxamine 5'-phosphate oxidase family protein n=1 Tax=Martelella lutilitoris TaxID=2583532 RepID=A0A7T7HPU0_9HYPH|nr:pyridoxamine 5'-phosphate oxidase family protein [Martelella lutilitoris]QQM33013.1 pyridoxamine 5'-phosphate oxidase family protein [Martelella lutilitoris]QRX65354.1 pyridoxamine 5'-phosphate oxidase family protein [Dysgonomonadaceae bacterium zrk40]